MQERWRRWWRDLEALKSQRELLGLREENIGGLIYGHSLCLQSQQLVQCLGQQGLKVVELLVDLLACEIALIFWLIELP